MMKTLAPAGGHPNPRARVLALPDSAELDPHEVAALLGCCVRSIDRLVQRGEFPEPYRLGRLRRWNLGRIRAFLRGRAEAAQAE